MAKSRRPDLSPSSPVRPVQVLSIKTGVPVVVRFLSGYGGILTHYAGKVPTWCAGPGVCPATEHKKKLIWKGYAPVHSWLKSAGQWQPDVLEITERLEEVLRGRDLRGEVWLLERRGEGHKSDPLFGAFCSRADLSEIGPTFDPLPVVQRLYHAPALQFGAANPMPPKVLLPNVAGVAPVLPRQLEGTEPRPLTDEEKEWANERLGQAFRFSDRFERMKRDGQQKNGEAAQPAGPQ